MRYSKILIPTQKEIPADVDTESQKLMIRSGMIKKVSSGLFVYLPYMKMMMLNVESIIRKEMNKTDACECKFPILVSKEDLDKSGRWEGFGKEMFALKDRNGKDYAISPTNEEYACYLAGTYIKSYKDMPMCVYQIQSKHRDEIRPRGGVTRAREFVMKDAYSFHANTEDLSKYYDRMRVAYTNIFSQFGMKAYPVMANNGTMGGTRSEEFMVVSDEGQDIVAFCEHCGTASNLEMVECIEKRGTGLSTKGDFSRIHTPHTATIEQLTSSLKISADNFAKSMVYIADGNVVVVMVRGDRNVNEAKLQKLLNATTLELADEKTIERIGTVIGFVGPIGLKPGVTIIADYEIKKMKNFVVGANQRDYHFKDVNLGDFECVYADVRFADQGDVCPICGKKLLFKKGNELGHIFCLGERYSKKMGANFVDGDGKYKPIQMGCYGIGLERIISAIIEQNHDDKGLILPVTVAPFPVEIIIVDTKKEDQVKVAEKLYTKLCDLGISTLLDDRSERAGFKFADSELLGIPVRITVGKLIEEGNIEVVVRKTGEKFILSINEAVKYVKELINL